MMWLRVQLLYDSDLVSVIIIVLIVCVFWRQRSQRDYKNIKYSVEAAGGGELPSAISKACGMKLGSIMKLNINNKGASMKRGPPPK